MRAGRSSSLRPGRATSCLLGRAAIKRDRSRRGPEAEQRNRQIAFWRANIILATAGVVQVWPPQPLVCGFRATVNKF